MLVLRKVPEDYRAYCAVLQVTSAAEVQDIKRARTLMKSMCTSNPGNARGWIAYARLEEVTGNLKTARTLISQVPKTP